MEAARRAIGNTPLAYLSADSARFGARLEAKLEFANPSGSIKDRTVYSPLLLERIRQGVITEQTTIVESSSWQPSFELGLDVCARWLTVCGRA